ncbi:pyridoxine 5'-phosphate synthase [Polaromonas sp.]|uniref:pyridoxine 5'-phosphate synthase n=1 Tax=Polaromonas sp. TaxID=1869339 RepID=UPI001853E080|nr:pyridoxine 5'-phosphate synthase [Polaromonas sp.]NMM05864.1 pyridoxine 5'-phosphate synthase [Polaromonas sp.]
MPLLSRSKPQLTPPAPPSAARGTPKTTLSVNINKVALLRNTRHVDLPSVSRAAELCLQAGAQGITVHPRPDERHIRPEDVYEISALMKEWPHCEFNIEGNPLQNLMHFVRDLSARGLPLHQCTFVPDSAEQFTSDHGWTFPDDAERLQPLIEQAHARGVRVSLFMDPVPEAMAAAKAIGADRVEFYTESYARAATPAQKNKALSRFVEAARAAAAINLGVNAGHDLNRENLTEFLRAVPGVLEVSIGHALIADALELGYAATVKDYLRCIDEALVPASPTPAAVQGSAA